MAFNQGVYDWVLANINNPQAIADAMAQFGVTSDQLAGAIGLDTSVVNNYLQSNNVQVQEPTPVDTGPVYTQEQLQEAGQFIVNNFDQPEVIAQVVQDLGLSTQDVLAAAQTVDPNLTTADVTNYLANATSPAVTQPVVTQPVDTGGGGGFEDVITDPVSGGATPVTPSTPTTVTTTTITDADNNTYDRATILKLAQQISQNFDASSSGGGAFGVTVEPDTTIGFKAVDVERILGQTPSSAQMVIFDMARGLAAQGITDVSEIAKYKPTEVEVTVEGEGAPTTQTVTKYIDPATGKEFSPNFGGTYAGEGGTNYGVNIDPSGTAKFVTTAEDTSDAGNILPIVSLALIAFPGVGTAIGSALGASGATATVLGNAIVNAGISVASGVPVDKALTNAAVSFGVSQFAPNLTNNVYIDNAVKAVAVASLTGGDVGNALANSLITTGATQELGNANITGDKATDSGIVSALASATSAAITGGNVAESAIQGFVKGASAATNQPETKVIPGGEVSISGAASNDSIVSAAGNDTINAGLGVDTTPSALATDVVTGGIGTTPDLGMDTTPSSLQNDVVDIVVQEQAANQAQSTEQAMQGAQQITTAEAQARELYPLTERYQGPNGTVYLRDVNTGKITQVLPQGEISQVTGGAVFLDTPKVIGAIEALPANAIYQGILYAGDPNLIGKQLTADDLASLSMSSGRDANVLPVGNLVLTQNADGTYTQRDKVTGDTATIDGTGKIVSQTKSAYTKANEVAGGLTGTAQAGLGELGAAISATAQQIGLDSQGAIDRFKAIQASGELMRPEYVNQQSQAFVDEIYRVASNPNSTTEQIARAIASAALNNPAGAAAILGTELIQELPQLLLPGGKVAQFLGSMALNAAESAGAQALQKIDELKATNPNATPQELARLARQDAGIAGAVTAAIGLIPGANNVVARTLFEPVSEALEEGLIEYLTSGDINAAKGKAVLGAVIGGKTAATINTGEELATAAQNNLGVKVPGGVGIPANASITVSGTRLPTDLTGTNVDPGVDLTPDNLGTLPTTGVDVPTFNVATGAEQTPVVTTTTTGEAGGGPTNITTGIVLQNNDDGTSLVLTKDGGATNVPSTDVKTGGALKPGSSVTVDTSNNTATVAGTDVSTATGTDTGTTTWTTTTTSPTTATDTSTATDTTQDTSTATGTNTATDTNIATGTNAATDTNTQTDTQTATDTNTNTNTNTQLNTNINTEEPRPKPPLPSDSSLPTPEDQLLQRIIIELEKPTIPETPPASIEEPPYTPPESVIETPPINVDQPLTIRTGVSRRPPPPGSRVEESTQLLPVRPGLSEGYLGDIEGTPEEKQQPVWNVRSLKLRRLLGI